MPWENELEKKGQLFFLVGPGGGGGVQKEVFPSQPLALLRYRQMLTIV